MCFLFPWQKRCAAATALVLMVFGMVIVNAGCATASKSRSLDPAGAYASDTLLYDLDGLTLQIAKTCDDVAAWAARNPAFVSAHADAQKIVARCAAEVDAINDPSETLRRLFAVREAYVLAKSAPNAEAVRREIGLAKTFLATARGLLAATTTL